MPSLLAQYYSRIKGSQEDIASEGLVYILNQSASAREALKRLVLYESGISLPELSFISQSTGTNNERPDISGIDSAGVESIILEAKFWASLTKNQPLEYLNRLGQDGLLIFVCPSLRLHSLRDEINLRLIEAGIQFTEVSNGFVLDGKKQLFLKSWSQVLEAIRFQLLQDREQILLSDLDQIIGFCEVVDRDSFIPIEDKDLSPGLAKRISSYYNLAYSVIDELKSQGYASTENLNATPQKFGYSRYFHHNLGRDGALYVHFELWQSIADTPFWLRIYDKVDGKWTLSEKTRSSLKEYSLRNGIPYHENSKREFFVPVYPIQGKQEKEVVADLAFKIRSVFDFIKEKEITQD